jgi:hypothetical protein
VNKKLKKSRCGFVVIKLRIDAQDYLLMRRDPDWKDVNFVGGHERVRDGGNLERAARRELTEEVPSLRALTTFGLEPLTDELTYGPVYSHSAKCEVEYLLKFFLLRFQANPARVLHAFGPRTHNVLIRQDDVIVGGKYRVAGLVNVLQRAFPNGLRAIPYSWLADLGPDLRTGRQSLGRQHELALE